MFYWKICIVMENYLQRIVKITEIEKITIGNLERLIGASGGVLYKAIRNNTDVQSKWIKGILDKFPHISPNWLLMGEGSIYKEEYFPKYNCETNKRVKMFCAKNDIDYNVFSEKTGLTMEGIRNTYPNLNPTWLLTGSGDMYIYNVNREYGSQSIPVDEMKDTQANFNIGNGNNTINNNIASTEVTHLRKRVEELEKLVEQKDRMIDILTQK